MRNNLQVSFGSFWGRKDPQISIIIIHVPLLMDRQLLVFLITTWMEVIIGIIVI